MLGYFDCAFVTACMLRYEGAWYDHQVDYLSDRRYRARCLAGCGNSVHGSVMFELGGVEYRADLNYREGVGTVWGGGRAFVVMLLDGDGYRIEMA